MNSRRFKQQIIKAPAASKLLPAKSIPLDRCPAAVYLAQLKQSSRRPQKQALNIIASLLSAGRADCLTLDWSVVRYQHTAAVRSHLLDRYAPATANRILSALRGVLQQAWLLGQMSAEDYHRAARLAPVIGETLPAGRELAAEEIAALIQSCIKDQSPIGIRDAAVISILFGCGLRREEVTTLDLNHYDLANAKAETLGIPAEQLSDTYYFSTYNNTWTPLNSQLRFGVP